MPHLGVIMSNVSVFVHELASYFASFYSESAFIKYDNKWIFLNSVLHIKHCATTSLNADNRNISILQHNLFLDNATIKLHYCVTLQQWERTDVGVFLCKIFDKSRYSKKQRKTSPLDNMHILVWCAVTVGMQFADANLKWSDCSEYSK